MAKNQFKFKLKITGFELEVEGSKEDVASITSTVSNQLKGLTSPPDIGDDAATEDADSTDVTPELPSLPNKKKSTKKAKTPVTASSKPSKQEAIDFKNDPDKYSSPTMQWSTLQKALWVLYVVHNERNIMELTTTQISETFNKHYKQSKTIRTSNISRDFGKVKQGQKALVQENTTVNPTTWYLTSEGIKKAQELITAEKN